MSSFQSIDTLATTREDYGELSLLESALSPDPMEQFKRWFEDYAKTEPKTHNAMVLSTVGSDNQPDSRVVLLKEVMDGAFVFYTDYSSSKGQQIAANPAVALNFYWSQTYQQVRIQGIAHQVTPEQSDRYFYSRPVESQLSTISSHQSQVIPNQAAMLAAYEQISAQHQHHPILRPKTWGGYAVVPHQMEFWQGRNNRLHDRIQYRLHDGCWSRSRLSP